MDRNEAALAVATIGVSRSICPVCSISLDNMKTIDMEMHIEGHFAKSPKAAKAEPDLEKQAQKLREQREFEMLRAQYGMDDQGNFREQSAAGMQRAVYAGEMSVADYYERQVGLRAAESHGIDDGTSCTKSVAPRVLSLSSASSSILRSVVCTAVDHYASNYGDKGWGCGYRNLQMILSSLLHVRVRRWISVLLDNLLFYLNRIQRITKHCTQHGAHKDRLEQLCRAYQGYRKWSKQHGHRVLMFR